ncbi:MAG TPA: glycoside hydrolase family 20 zincin-like fold domain-containing protein, partial [Candidatus Dormibacteraeota bacterium]|nr:glycoside hydrolase family 20 zincin-like fold domain-containing protein [Candidatus Dormibacteraeota bacterium]
MGSCALLCSGAALTAAPAPEALLADVGPAPAVVSPGRGSFALGAATVVHLPHDAGASEVARYFIALLREQHPAWLEVRAAAAPGPAIEFVLEPGSPADSPEAYELSIEPRHVRVRSHD